MPKRKFKSAFTRPLMPADFITDPKWNPEKGTLLVLFDESGRINSCNPFGVVVRNEREKNKFHVRIVGYNGTPVERDLAGYKSRVLKVTAAPSFPDVEPDSTIYSLNCRCRRIASHVLDGWKVDVTDTEGNTVSDCYVKLYCDNEDYIIPYHEIKKKE